MGKLKIQVTKEDIAKGTRKDPRSCPIALAIKRVSKDAYVSVGYNSFQIGNAYRNNTPTMKRFTRAFDKYESVKPFTIIVDAPNPSRGNQLFSNLTHLRYKKYGTHCRIGEHKPRKSH